VAEWRLFPEGVIPEYTTAVWYQGRERAPHLEQDGHRQRIELTAEIVTVLAGQHSLRSVTDLGCGDGGLLSLLACSGMSTWGYDLSPEAVKGAIERGVTAYQMDVVNDWPLLGDLVVAGEMLEHLVNPHAFVRRLRSGCAYMVASSPFTETAASHYEFHTWAWDLDGYRALFENNGWRVVLQETVQSFQVIAAAGT